jgi:hypothetical protein
MLSTYLLQDGDNVTDGLNLLVSHQHTAVVILGQQALLQEVEVKTSQLKHRLLKQEFRTGVCGL